MEKELYRWLGKHSWISGIQCFVSEDGISGGPEAYMPLDVAHLLLSTGHANQRYVPYAGKVSFKDMVKHYSKPYMRAYIDEDAGCAVLVEANERCEVITGYPGRCVSEVIEEVERHFLFDFNIYLGSGVQQLWENQYMQRATLCDKYLVRVHSGLNRIALGEFIPI